MKLRTSVAAALAVAGITTLSAPAQAAGGVWDTALGPGSGSGATSASPWISAPAAGSIYAEWNFFTDDTGAPSWTKRPTSAASAWAAERHR